MERIKKLNRSTLPYMLLFLVGILFCAYPLISRLYYRMDSQDTIEQFEKASRAIQDKEIQRKLDLARAYNSTLNPAKMADPYNEKEKEGIAEYARMLEVREMIGHVEIPKLKLDIPIYAGTSDAVLEKGAGHLEGSSLPIGGENTHTVITAHRGLASAEMFRYLDQLKKGDVFHLHNIEGVLAYKVDQIVTVEPTDFEKVLVVEGEDYATLLTCTPYLVNSHRLLVRGYRIPYQPEVEPVEDNGFYWDLDIILLVVIVCGLLFLFWLLFGRKKKRKKK